MKTLVPLAAALAILGADAALAEGRYASPPPLTVSPDLSAPWVMQLERAPVRARGLKLRAEPGRGRADEASYAPRRISPSAYAPTRKERRAEIDPIYMPQEVSYDGKHKPGTIVIDTTQNFLFLVGENGKARRYGVGTGKPGFEWAGTHKITSKREWPDWRPPAEMIARERAKGRILPAHMKGGLENPLGARALYLGSTLYRIHGTNEPWTIGGAVSSGCIRMRNEDVVDLYGRVKVGTTVVVI